MHRAVGEQSRDTDEDRRADQGDDDCPDQSAPLIRRYDQDEEPGADDTADKPRMSPTSP